MVKVMEKYAFDQFRDPALKTVLSLGSLAIFVLSAVSCGSRQATRRTVNIPTSNPATDAGSNGAPLPDPAAGTLPPDPQQTEQDASLVWDWPNTTLPQEDQVLTFEGGVPKNIISILEAQSEGYQLIDLSDDWVPYIFWSQNPQINTTDPSTTHSEQNTEYRENHYANTYVRLANDEIDVDGRHLKKGQHNYLEVYGIPPTLAVLRKRWLLEKDNDCLTPEAQTLFSSYFGPVKVTSSRSLRRLKARLSETMQQLQHALKADTDLGAKHNENDTEVQDDSGDLNRNTLDQAALEKLKTNPQHAPLIEAYRRDTWRLRAIEIAQDRLRCESLLSARSRIHRGILDRRTRESLRQFEKKNHIYGWGKIYKDTASALGRSSSDNIYDAFKRVIAERVTSAMGLVEDGSATGSYIGEDGAQHTVQNEIAEFTRAALTQMGIQSTKDMASFFNAVDNVKSRRLIVGLKLPQLPEYYTDHMDLEVRIDRGDIWYDVPLDKKKRFKQRSRARYPKTTLYVKYRDQKIPLVTWRTTIGGWQKEKRGNEVYVKYKVSDIGRRYWRHIIAGPVWVPPPAAPTGAMVKHRAVGRRNQAVVGQSTTGPGFASAYGLVAAFHVTANGFDNQIRTHGSVNYMSIKSGYSHGCHRLRNVNAVHLFSFVLQHRHFRRKGQSNLAFHRKFEHKGESFQINLHTRGYYYEMLPPVPVIVSEGRIRGAQKKPLKDYIKLPTKMYQEDLPELKRRQHKGAPLKNDKTDTQSGHDLKSVQSL